MGTYANGFPLARLTAGVSPIRLGGTTRAIEGVAQWRVLCRAATVTAMNPTLQDVPKTEGGPAAADPFNVILVYEDRASALRGLALYQRLVTELGDDHDFNLNVWKFAVLGVARLAEVSTEQAAAADLIIVCMRDEAEPTEQVQAWFRRWMDVKGHNECALVVLNGPAQNRYVTTGKNGFFRGLGRSGVTVFPPGARAGGDSAAQPDGRGWLPRSTHPHGVDGWFHPERCNTPSAPNSPSARKL